MRMTNKIMRNNAAYNINQNKILQDKLTNQMTNQSKIVRPSDDPVVAIRALRLRSNVTAVTQYNERNAKDADQWLSLTADAMDTVDKVLNDLYKQATSAPNKFETADDLRIYLTQMKQLTAEFYSCANVDYAGRFVFSGYRTDLPVTFTAEDIKQMEEHPVSYNIDENFGFHDISRISYTDYTKVEEGLVPNPPGSKPDVPKDIDDVHSYEQAVNNTTLYRFRISYNNLDSLGKGGDLKITMPDGTKIVATAKDKDGNVQLDADNKPIVTTTPVDEDGNPLTGVQVPEIKEFGDQEEAYKAIADGTFTGIAYIPSSGELVFSEDICNEKFHEKVFEGGGTFQVNYDKSNWKNGDINPVHYFKCIETKNVAAKGETPDWRKTSYNTQRDQGRDQDIYYDVGYNQQIQVNTRADEIFTHNVQRDMDDFEHYLNQLQAIETLKKDLETKKGEFPEDSDEYKDIMNRIEGADKAWDYIRENIHTKFENQITKYQQYMDDSRVAMTDNATRGSRLELIATRLTNQQATFKELQQDNEGIDITEVAVEMTSAELTYNAALMATGKIMQTNLMNYI
ncbi:MAG: hypothetical protein K2N00_11670 [Lachnospiraceae bacterium]|nr:hypothetical protein [Lachnospiraceae bacterium]